MCGSHLAAPTNLAGCSRLLWALLWAHSAWPGRAPHAARVVDALPPILHVLLLHVLQTAPLMDRMHPAACSTWRRASRVDSPRTTPPPPEAPHHMHRCPEVPRGSAVGTSSGCCNARVTVHPRAAGTSRPCSRGTGRPDPALPRAPAPTAPQPHQAPHQLIPSPEVPGVLGADSSRAEYAPVVGGMTSFTPFGRTYDNLSRYAKGSTRTSQEWAPQKGEEGGGRNGRGRRSVLHQPTDPTLVALVDPVAADCTPPPPNPRQRSVLMWAWWAPVGISRGGVTTARTRWVGDLSYSPAPHAPHAGPRPRMSEAAHPGDWWRQGRVERPPVNC
jgi:hypothetical protein